CEPGTRRQPAAHLPTRHRPSDPSTVSKPFNSRRSTARTDSSADVMTSRLGCPATSLLDTPLEPYRRRLADLQAETAQNAARAREKHFNYISRGLDVQRPLRRSRTCRAPQLWKVPQICSVIRAKWAP